MMPTRSSPRVTRPTSVARGWMCGGLVPPGAKSTRFMDTPSVFTPGHSDTSSSVTLEPFGFASGSPPVAILVEKRNSSPAADGGRHGWPFTDGVPLRSATQKSWRGSGSAAMTRRGASSSSSGSVADSAVRALLKCSIASESELGRL